MRAKCRHCAVFVASRPRGLCWTCYADESVRACYPSTSKFGYRGLANFCGEARGPAVPTQALPGTPEKVAVMAQRVSLGQSLWHPEDAPLDMRRFAKVG